MNGRAYPHLSEAGPEVIFNLPDTSTKDLAIECIVEQESGGIAIKAGDVPHGEGRPVFIEWRNGMLAVHVWADANNESPTHSIEIPLGAKFDGRNEIQIVIRRGNHNHEDQA